MVAPSVPMPAANYRTVLSRWKRWSVVGGWERPDTGAHVDPDGLIAAALKADPSDKLLFLMKDGAGVNGCMEACIADLTRRTHARPGAVTMFALTCLSHSCVLSMKPSMQSLEGVVPALTHLGHLFSGGRFARRFMETLHGVVEDTIKFCEVPVLPPGAEAWIAESRKVLAMTRPAMDVSAEGRISCSRSSTADGTNLISRMASSIITCQDAVAGAVTPSYRRSTQEQTFCSDKDLQSA